MSMLNARVPAPRVVLVTAARGVLRWRFSSPLGVNPGAGGIPEAHEAIKGIGT